MSSAACFRVLRKKIKDTGVSRHFHKSKNHHNARCSTFSAFEDRLDPTYQERPTPICFVSGEFLNSSIWGKSIKYFSERGMSGVAMSLPILKGDDIYGIADRTHRVVEECQMIPPIMVTHSLSSYMAQKYLESYSLSGIT